MAPTEPRPPFVERLQALYLPIVRTYLLIASSACALAALTGALTGPRQAEGWVSLADLGASAAGFAGAGLLRRSAAAIRKQACAVTVFNLCVTATVFVRLACGEATTASFDFAILALIFAMVGPTPATAVISTALACAGALTAILSLPASIREGVALSEAPAGLAAMAGALLRQKVMRNLACDHMRMVQLNLSLEGERAKSLGLAVQFRRASDAKSAFLTRMSHDLRTPLNGVAGTIDLLSQSRLTRRQREMCDLASASTRAVVALVSDLFDASQLETGLLDLNTEPFNLTTCLTEIADAARPMVIGKGLIFEVQIDLDPGVVVDADPVRLRQAVSNLLSNAVKFTEAGRVSLRANAQTGPDPDRLAVRICVSDTGAGLDPVDGERLFRPFEQDQDPRPSGCGLGLAIVKSIMERMDGDVLVEGAPGCGAAFTLLLDLPRAAQAPIPAWTPGRDEKLRILAADDHPTNRKVIELMLLPAASSLTLVEDGRAAVDAWLSAEFDVVLMDMQMPIMDGLEAIRLIRTLEREMRRPRTPIAMLTAATMPENVAAALAAGADLHLAKPITPAVLASGLRRTIELAHAENESLITANSINSATRRT